jgi:hypothetical protein
MQSLGRTERSRQVKPVGSSRKQGLKPEEKGDFPEELARQLDDRGADADPPGEPEEQEAGDANSGTDNLNCDLVQIESLKRRPQVEEGQINKRQVSLTPDSDSGDDRVHIDIKA